MMVGLAEAGGYAIVGAAMAYATIGLAGLLRRWSWDAKRRDVTRAIFRERARVSLDRAKADRERAQYSWNGVRKFVVARCRHRDETLAQDLAEVCVGEWAVEEISPECEDHADAAAFVACDLDQARQEVLTLVCVCGEGEQLLELIDHEDEFGVVIGQELLGDP